MKNIFFTNIFQNGEKKKKEILQAIANLVVADSIEHACEIEKMKNSTVTEMNETSFRLSAATASSILIFCNKVITTNQIEQFVNFIASAVLIKIYEQELETEKFRNQHERAVGVIKGICEDLYKKQEINTETEYAWFLGKIVTDKKDAELVARYANIALKNSMKMIEEFDLIKILR